MPKKSKILEKFEKEVDQKTQSVGEIITLIEQGKSVSDISNAGLPNQMVRNVSKLYRMEPEEIRANNERLSEMGVNLVLKRMISNIKEIPLTALPNALKTMHAVNQNLNSESESGPISALGLEKIDSQTDLSVDMVIESLNRIHVNDEEDTIEKPHEKPAET